MTTSRQAPPPSFTSAPQAEMSTSTGRKKALEGEATAHRGRVALQPDLDAAVCKHTDRPPSLPSKKARQIAGSCRGLAVAVGSKTALWKRCWKTSAVGTAIQACPTHSCRSLVASARAWRSCALLSFAVSPRTNFARCQTLLSETAGARPTCGPRLRGARAERRLAAHVLGVGDRDLDVSVVEPVARP